MKKKNKFPPDFKKEDIDRLRAILDKSEVDLLEGISTEKLTSYFDLYLSGGKTYREIAKITKEPLEKILFLAWKFKWYDKKISHYEDISNSIITKHTQAKIAAVSALSTMIAAYSKYFEKKFNIFLSSQDIDVIEKLDHKSLAQYYKALDSLEKIMNKSSPVLGSGSSSSVGGSGSGNHVNSNLESEESEYRDYDSESGGETKNRSKDMRSRSSDNDRLQEEEKEDSEEEKRKKQLADIAVLLSEFEMANKKKR